MMILVLAVSMVLAMDVANGHQRSPVRPHVRSNDSLVSPSALYVLGDSSVDCGDNTLFYPLLRQNLSLHPCNGSDTSLLPNLLAEKMGLPHIQPFYAQNGSIEALVKGLNFGSAQATIMNPGSLTHQSLNQQLRQVYETFQLFQLQLNQDRAFHLINSSIFYLSFGKDDYINLLLHNDSRTPMFKYSSKEFSRILVNQMTRVIMNLYDANVRKILCMGILPLGCAPRTMWEWSNSSATTDKGGGGGGAGKICVEEINEFILEYNTMLEENIVELNKEMLDANIVFCDVYKGIMEMITNPKRYGFEDVKSACCGLGLYGGMIGCLSIEMACDKGSRKVWWDFYNPTHAVNSLLADSAWSGHPLVNICRPFTVRELVSTSVLHPA